MVTGEGDVFGRSRGVGIAERVAWGCLFSWEQVPLGHHIREVHQLWGRGYTAGYSPEFQSGATGLPFWGGGVPRFGKRGDVPISI